MDDLILDGLHLRVDISHSEEGDDDHGGDDHDLDDLRTLRHRLAPVRRVLVDPEQDDDELFGEREDRGDEEVPEVQARGREDRGRDCVRRERRGIAGWENGDGSTHDDQGWHCTGL